MRVKLASNRLKSKPQKREEEKKFKTSPNAPAQSDFDLRRKKRNPKNKTNVTKK